MMKNNQKKPQTLGLYLHIPFCLRKCNYCDFYSAPCGKEIRSAYVRALCAQIKGGARQAKGMTVDTVYFGGGTPTLLEGEDFSRILFAVKENYTLAADAEISSECNPATGDGNLFAAMKEAGVNRISIGLQSAHDDELKTLGRLHTFEDFKKTYALLRQLGFENLNIDVMFALPHSTLESYLDTLRRVAAFSPQHISAYALRVEEDSPFFNRITDLSLPDEDTAADMQEQGAALLSSFGYEHYEISNYAKPGFASKHNLRYWLGTLYLGFGPGAHSYFNGERFSVAADTAAYIAAGKKGDFSALITGKERIVGKEKQDEYVMLRMRLFQGLNEAEFLQNFGVSLEKTYGPFDRLISGGFLKRENGNIAFTEKGMLISNSILSDWLDFGK